MKNVCKLFYIVVILALGLGTSHGFAGIDDDIETIFKNASPKAKKIFPEVHLIHSWRDIWFLKTFGKLESIPEYDALKPKGTKSKKLIK
jgi:hypothetical protein